MQQHLFEFKEGNKWEDEWLDMPEYKNEVEQEPAVIAIIKFRRNEDFEVFKDYIQKYLYNGEKPFDGMQRKEKKSTWFPPKEKFNKYIYTNES